MAELTRGASRETPSAIRFSENGFPIATNVEAIHTRVSPPPFAQSQVPESSFVGLTDNLVDLLILERKNFWLKNNHPPQSDIQHLWNRRVTELGSAVAPSIYNGESTSKFTNNQATFSSANISRHLSTPLFTDAHRFIGDVSSPSPTKQLASYFEAPSQAQGEATSQVSRSFRRYSESEIQQIQELLRQQNGAWTEVPRTYIVLRLTDELALLDPLIKAGFTDHWFPIVSLPGFVKLNSKRKIVDAQPTVLTGVEDLERVENGGHILLEDGESLPFVFKARLGAGGYGQVDKVISELSSKEYARKLIMRQAVLSTPSAIMERFVEEVKNLKRVRHRHMVALVGSYTDINYLGLFMTPVAECNLAAYLRQVSSSDGQKPLLRSFFGCLTAGLAYLHDSRIRHKDIKPENILVKQQNILYTDFGLARDSLDVSRSISTGRTAFTPAYCAPEVAAFEPRDSSSDVWSLGCVFLEMVSTLKDHTVKDLLSFFQDQGSGSTYLRNNCEAYQAWDSVLRGLSDTDNAPLDWISDMVHHEANARSTAQEILDRIIHSTRELPYQAQYCGICCRGPLITSSFTKQITDLSTSQNQKNKTVKVGGLPPINSKLGRKLKRKRDTQDESGNSPVPQPTSIKKSQIDWYTWSAAKRGDTERVMRLLAQGASPNFAKDDGTSTLHWAAKNGCVEIFNALIASGADFNSRDHRGLSILHYAVSTANIEIIKTLLKLNTSNCPDDRGTTPLCLAAELGRETILPILLEKFGTDLDRPDNDGGTPLAWAAFTGKLKAVQTLADRGALVDRRCTRWGRTPLSWAAETGQWEVIKYLIGQKQADPDSIALDTGMTPLSHACKKGHLQVVLTLLETKAVDIAVRDNDGKSALDFARLSKRKKIVSALEDFQQRATGTEPPLQA